MPSIRTVALATHDVDYPVATADYPLDHVVGVIARSADARIALHALTAGGFRDDDVRIATGAEAADLLHASTEHHALIDWIVRAAPWVDVADEEMEVKMVYERALRHGATIISVEAPSDLDQRRAGAILSRHGAHTVNHFCRFVPTELVVLGATK